MQKQHTIYHIIVDKSGSMGDSIEQTISGFNEQLTKIRELGIEFPQQQISVGLTTFNNRITHHYFQENPALAPLLNDSTYRPNGSTALLDAIGSVVHEVRKRMILSETEIGKTTAVIVIITDGYENSSKCYTLNDIRRSISELEETGCWTFSYLGATLDAVDIANELSIKRQNSFSYDKSKMKDGVWDTLAFSMKSYMLKKENDEDLGNFLSK
jgi:hypothetical protein